MARYNGQPNGAMGTSLLMLCIVWVIVMLFTACVSANYVPWVEPEPHERNVAKVDEIIVLTRAEWSWTPWYRALKDQILPPHLTIFVAVDGRACIIPEKELSWVGAIPGQYYQCNAGWRIASMRNRR